MSYELLTNRKTENRHKNYRQVNDIFFLVVHWWDDKKGLSFDSNVNFLCKITIKFPHTMFRRAVA